MNVCYTQTSGRKKSTSKAAKAAKPSAAVEGAVADPATTTGDPLTSSAAADNKEKKGRSKGECLYYRVKCKDNGVGMPHDKVG